MEVLSEGINVNVRRNTVANIVIKKNIVLAMREIIMGHAPHVKMVLKVLIAIKESVKMVVSNSPMDLVNANLRILGNSVIS